jgi:hypothetical protein
MPIKAEYGPTLGTLLAPRWHAAAPRTRRAVIVAGVALLALLVAITLSLLDASYSRGGRVPFSFRYRGLYRVAPEPGGFIRVVKRSPSGRLLYSFAVAPLSLPPYTGEQSGVLPIYAASYIRALRRSFSGFELAGEGKTRVNTVPAYAVQFTAIVEGREMFGRNVLLLPECAGAREGVQIQMLTAPDASKQIKAPLEVGTTGVLQRPLRSFSIACSR